jgi:hypothetical protein
VLRILERELHFVTRRFLLQRGIILPQRSQPTPKVGNICLPIILDKISILMDRVESLTVP